MGEIMFNSKKCTDNILDSSEPYIEGEKLLQQIQNEDEKDTTESTKKSTINVVSRHICEYCGEEKMVFQFPCSRCGMVLCVRHRIPELHECMSVSWVFTDQYTKHILNDYAIPEPNNEEETKGAKKA
jgi:hypothetical protein